MEENLISIIIPIYNTKNYLDKCLSSVINQTYKNLEILLIINTDTDDFQTLCQKYKTLDSRIKILHVSNVSVGEARNIGLKHSTGNYISFIDSDDYINPDMIELLLKNIIKTNADIADIGFAKEFNNQLEKKIFSDKIEVLNQTDALVELLKNQKLQSYVWNKLFKKEVWNNIWFSPDKMFEDIDIMYKLFLNVNTLVVIDSLKYIYVQRNTSIVHTHNSSFILDKLNVIIDRYNHLRNCYSNQILFFNKYAIITNIIEIFITIVLEEYNDIYNDFLSHYNLFLEIINEHEKDIRPILTKNQNLVLDFMLEGLDTAPEKIKSVKDIDK